MAKGVLLSVPAARRTAKAVRKVLGEPNDLTGGAKSGIGYGKQPVTVLITTVEGGISWYFGKVLLDGIDASDDSGITQDDADLGDVGFKVPDEENCTILNYAEENNPAGSPRLKAGTHHTGFRVGTDSDDDPIIAIDVPLTVQKLRINTGTLKLQVAYTFTPAESDWVDAVDGEAGCT